MRNNEPSALAAFTARLHAISGDLERTATEFADLDSKLLDELRSHAASLIALSDSARRGPSLEPLSPAMARVLAHVRQFIREHGFAPTRQEIAQALGFASGNGAQCHLTRLAQRGLITIVDGQARGIRVNERTLSAQGVA